MQNIQERKTEITITTLLQQYDYTKKFYPHDIVIKRIE